MINQTIMRIGFYYSPDTQFDFALVIPCAVLPDVRFDSRGWHIELVIMPPSGGITKQRESRSIGFRFICSQVKAGMGGRNERSHGPTFLTQSHFAAFDINTD